MKYLVSILFLFCVYNSFAQNDSITLFTKQACGNCKYAKEQLEKNNILYKNLPLENNVNARLMLQTLAKLGYTERMHLPIILVNNTLYHPAIKEDSIYRRVSLSKAIDTILFLQNTKTFTFTQNIYKDSIQEVEEHSDCEVNITPFYIVCKNFSTEKEALDYSLELRDKGFENAGYINYKKYYRVFSYLVFSQEEANKALLESRAKFNISYILEIK